MAETAIPATEIDTNNAPVTIFTGAANGTYVRKLLISNAGGNIGVGRFNVYLVASGGTAGNANRIVTSANALFSQITTVEPLTDLLVAQGASLQVEKIPGQGTADPSLVVFGQYEDI